MKARSRKKTTKKRRRVVREKIPPSPIDRLGWSGKSRNVRIRIDHDHVREAEYERDTD